MESLVPVDCQHSWQVKFVGDDIISRLLGHLDYRSAFGRDFGNVQWGEVGVVDTQLWWMRPIRWNG